MKRIPLKGGEEQDCFSKRRQARKNIKPGVNPSVKAAYRRRFRKAEKKITEQEVRE